MKITVFTSNQPRHNSLINKLSLISDELYAIQECNTVMPGKVDDFFKKSPIMQEYFLKVIEAERNLFSKDIFLNKNVKSLPIRSGDLNFLSPETLKPALNSDMYIVFGSSFIKGWLIETLVKKKAINIHMGISPYYRGSSCNFWALYDNNPSFVGATIHMLTKGLDSGPIFHHCLPKLENENPFEFTMKSVLAAQVSLVSKIKNKKIFSAKTFNQDKTKEIRYTRNVDFNEKVALDFLKRKVDNKVLLEKLEKNDHPELIDPFFL